MTLKATLQLTGLLQQEVVKLIKMEYERQCNKYTIEKKTIKKKNKPMNKRMWNRQKDIQTILGK